MEKELSCINSVQSLGDSKAISYLIAENTGIYLRIVDDFLPENLFPIQKNELKADKDFNIYKATMLFDASKGMKFSTFLAQTIKWKCLELRSNRKRGKEKDMVSMDDVDFSLPEKPVESCEGKVLIERIFQFAEKYPNELARKIINYRYNSQEKKPWKEIATELNISTQWARILHNDFLRDAKEYFNQK